MMHGTMNIKEIYLLCFTEFLLYPRKTINEKRIGKNQKGNVLSLNLPGSNIDNQLDATITVYWQFQSAQHVSGDDPAYLQQH